MSFLDKLKDQFVDRDEDYEEEYEDEEEEFSVPSQPARSSAAVARGVSVRQTKPYTMVVVNPQSYEDAEKIGDHLKESRPVVMNMEKTDDEQARRIVDFVQGIMYALDGRIDHISENIYLCAPNNMSVSRESFADIGNNTEGAAVPQWEAGDR